MFINFLVLALVFAVVNRLIGMDFDTKWLSRPVLCLMPAVPIMLLYNDPIYAAVVCCTWYVWRTIGLVPWDSQFPKVHLIQTLNGKIRATTSTGEKIKQVLCGAARSLTLIAGLGAYVHFFGGNYWFLPLLLTQGLVYMLSGFVPVKKLPDGNVKGYFIEVAEPIVGLIIGLTVAGVKL